MLRHALWTVAAIALTGRGAWAATVHSVPVGAQRIPLPEGRSFIASPFEAEPHTILRVLGTNQLPAGSTESQATIVDVWNPNAQTLTNRYWLSNAEGFEGWRKSGTFAVANDVELDQQKGMILTVRAGHGDQSVDLHGQVPRDIKAQTIFGGNRYTLVCSAFPVPVSLAQSGLLPSGFQGGASLVTSDNLLFFNPTNGQFDVKIWYDAAAAVWRNADASIATRLLRPGESFLVRRRAPTDMVWSNPPPYSLP